MLDIIILILNSAGLWEPYQIFGTPVNDLSKWGLFSFNHFQQLMHSVDADIAGIRLVTAYTLFKENDDDSDPFWKDIVHGFQRLKLEAIRKMGVPERFISGYSFGKIMYICHQIQ